MEDIILSVKDLVREFDVRGKKEKLTAVNGVSFDVKKGETFGLVGESGCGKSTMGMMLLNLLPATSGEILFEGNDIKRLNKEEIRKMRRDIQITFQDPYSSLNPRMRVCDLISEPLKIHKMGTKEEIEAKVGDLMLKVGLPLDMKNRFPHEFSGGQKQRIVIARALSLNPKLLVLDEPVSALDVSVQSQILNLLKDLQKEYNLTYVFIAHGMNVVKHMSDRVAVMYLGNIVEMASGEELYGNPLHPYTKALFSAIPTLDADMKVKRVRLEGDVPSPINRPPGCAFNVRCTLKNESCKEQCPSLTEVSKGHFVACNVI